MDKTKPNGRVIGIDLIPAQPPRGVATFQGDFLSPNVQEMVKNFILDTHKRPPPLQHEAGLSSSDEVDVSEVDRPSYIDMERHASSESESSEASGPDTTNQRLVDVCPHLASHHGLSLLTNHACRLF